MREEKIQASVIIPCRNEAKYIEGVIDAILSNTIKNTEIIVVDGMSEDGTREILKKKSAENLNVKIIDNPQRITPVAFNLGIKNAVGEFVFIVGARHVLQNNYIETCIDILKQNKEIACVGGKVKNIFENETSELISKAMSSPFAVGASNFRIIKEDSFVDTVGTPAYRKTIFDEIGYFDEDLLRNQDDELNFRVTKKGYKIFFTVKTSISYYVRASYKNLLKQFTQYGYWKVFVNRKHKAITTSRQLVPFFFVLYLIFGSCLGFVHPYLFYGWLCGLGIYLAAAFFFALKVNAVSTIFATVFCFLILHLGYGWGYLEGIIDFIILGKKKAKGHETISR